MVLEHHLKTAFYLILAVSVMAANHQAGTGFSTNRPSESDELKKMDASASLDRRSITAEPGETVTLPCRAHLPVTVLQWHKGNRSEYVLSYRDEQFDPEDQDPSFVNRVALKDKQITDGDASLIIKNITTRDAGVYECRAIQGTPNRGKRQIPVISIVRLEIVYSEHRPEDEKMGSKDELKVGLSVGFGVVVLAAVVVAGVCIYKRRSCPAPCPTAVI